MQQRAGALLALLAVAGCTPPPAPQRYELSGQILVIRPETREVLIRHGDIPGFMPGMTMPFTVRDASLLEGRAPGDLVTATLMVAPDAAWLSTLTATGRAPLPADAPASLPAATGVQIRNVGDQVPGTAMRTSGGQAMALTDLKGRAVALTFIYTSCPLADFCPLLDRRFAEIQRRVSRDVTLAGHVTLVSVSFDRTVDTAARLADHARALAADPATWHFATVNPDADSDRFAAEFGVNVIREPDGTITHNLRTYVIGPSGVVVSVRDGNQWTADDVVGDLREALGRGRS